MNLSNKREKKIGDLRKNRAHSEFFGREEPLKVFHDNLALAHDDPRRRLIFNIYGQGGVGKSSLKRQYIEIANQRGFITVEADEPQANALEVMVHLASLFKKQQSPLEEFDRRYEEYRQKRRQLEDMPDTPPQFANFMARTVVKGSVGLVSQIPGLGVLSPFINAEDLAKQSENVVAWVYGKFSKKEDRDLIATPLEVLTPLFLSGVEEAAARRDVVLIFDTFERTGEYLEPWLLGKTAVIDNLPTNIIVVIAGRKPLGNLWEELEGLIVRQLLEPFTEAEARDYLARKKITDVPTVEIILRLSGGLPLLLATLAAGNPNDPTAEAGTNETAVERFLKWVEDQEQRGLVLDSALPRRFNLDVLTALGAQKVESQFDWLKEMPFVQERSEGWIYHSVVRDQMLRYRLRKSPLEWAGLHGRLADYYDKLRGQLGLDEAQGWADATWQRHALEVLYHRLCQAPHNHLPDALNGFVRALKVGFSFGRRWAETMQQAGRDAGQDAAEVGVARWGDRLVGALKAYDEDRFEDVVKAYTELLESAPLKLEWRAEVFDQRGNAYMKANQYVEGLADFEQAVGLAPDSDDYRFHRGLAYALIERSEESLADFNYFIERNPSERAAIGLRSNVHITLGNLPAALEDLNRSHELAPKDADILAQRGRLYILMGESDKALDDINRAAELEPGNVFLLSLRLTALLQKGDTAEAVKVSAAIAAEATKFIREFKKITADIPAKVLSNASRPFVSKLGFEADSMVPKLLQLMDDEEAGVRSLRAEAAAIEGLHHFRQGELDKALVAFVKATELDPNNPTYWASQGEIHMRKSEPVEAMACFNGALELDADNIPALNGRSQISLAMGDYGAALVDLDRLIALQTDSLLLLAIRLSILEKMGDLEERVKTYRRIGERAAEFVKQLLTSLPASPPQQQAPPVAEQPPPIPDQQNRFLDAVRNDQDEAVRFVFAEVADAEAGLHLIKGELEEAKAQYTVAIDFDPGSYLYRFRRGLVNRLLKCFGEALEDLSHALELAPGDVNVLAERGLTYQLLGRHEEALADLDRVVEADPNGDMSRFARSLSYRRLGRAEEGEKEFDAAVELALELYRESPEHSANTLDLALYRAAAGQTEEAERLYREALAGGATSADVRAAIYDLEWLLGIFPNSEQAAAMLELLRNANSQDRTQ